MIITVSFRAFDSPGDHRTHSLIGDFPSLDAPSFGDAVTRIDVARSCAPIWSTPGHRGRERTPSSSTARRPASDRIQAPPEKHRQFVEGVAFAALKVDGRCSAGAAARALETIAEVQREPGADGWDAALRTLWQKTLADTARILEPFARPSRE